MYVMYRYIRTLMLAIVMVITTEQVKIENFEAVCFVPCSLCGSNLTIKHRISSRTKSSYDQAQNQLAHQVILRASTESACTASHLTIKHRISGYLHVIVCKVS